jgi:hypothetical protein
MLLIVSRIADNNGGKQGGRTISRFNGTCDKYGPWSILASTYPMDWALVTHKTQFAYPLGLDWSYKSLGLPITVEDRASLNPM